MKIARSVGLVVALGLMAGGAVFARTLEKPRHNVILFVADGLRSQIVTPQTAPALAALRAEGVDFQNSHSVYPTVTTANASAMATGHYFGDTGNFGNNIFVGMGRDPAAASGVTPFLEDSADIDFVNDRFGGNYLTEDSLLAQFRAAGYVTASIGKRGPTSVHDITTRDGGAGILIDDSTGDPKPLGVSVADDVAAAISALGLPVHTPARTANADSGTFERPGTKVANTLQQDWFVTVATKVLLPRFKKSGKPFAMVYWSRDPDGSQHGQGDSLNSLTPGINGPTAMAGIRNASDNLQILRDALKAQGLDKTTDIVVTADHGFATVSRQSQTSPSARMKWTDTVTGFLPPSYLAMDLSLALQQPVWNPNGTVVKTAEGVHPSTSGALIGPDPAHPNVVVAVNGGSDLIYVTGGDRMAVTRQIVSFLTAQDYVGGLFVDDDLGRVPGALPMSAINLIGEAKTPRPSIVVSFRSWTQGCAKPETCVVLVADTSLQQGQGAHGSLSRGETHNFMAATGPDFKKGFVDRSPVSNADLAWTIAKAVGLKFSAKGRLTGRAAVESIKGGPPSVASEAKVLRSDKAQNGFQTVLNYQVADGRKYFDAAGMPGRVYGLKP